MRGTTGARQVRDFVVQSWLSGYLQDKMARDERGCWLPGTSPNPSGRPAGSISLESRLKRKLRENPKLAAQIVNTIVSKSIGKDADPAFLKILLDRHDGPVRRTIEVHSETVDAYGAAMKALAKVYPKNMEQAERFAKAMVEELSKIDMPLNMFGDEAEGAASP